MKNRQKRHGKHVFEVGRLMEESAKTIGTKGAKIGGTRSIVGGLKHGHGRDSGHPTAVTVDSS